MYVGQDADGEISNQMMMARPKTDKNQLGLELKSPIGGKIPVIYPINFVKKNHNRKS